jgi:GNAT superfamily N-acetyltransferase
MNEEFTGLEPRYSISTEKSQLDVPFIHKFLSEECYWALGRPYAVVVHSIENSLCFGAYLGGRQAGFARVVTDYATFAWLDDVFVIPAERGKGISKALVQAVVNHPDLSGLRRMMLATRDAHDLYRNYGGFEVVKTPQRWMERFSG